MARISISDDRSKKVGAGNIGPLLFRSCDSLLSLLAVMEEPHRKAACWGYTPLLHSVGPHFLAGRTQVNMGQIDLGVRYAGTNTAREGYELAALQAGDVTTVDFYVDLPELYPASFSFSPAIADGTLMGYQMCDWIDNAITLQMGRSEAQIYGYIHLPCRVEVNARIRTERQLENQLG